ncbi:hypothetical protein C7M84_008942 [Penaeus vannamei]|uniref:Protein kinase domain-containing protein n=1 Tax=Penaeus vannamei TaxID=6689 RepID=A0A423T890_PENVA|nr:hypothetical protein C7M84_008942 [Penaeus vannamei]
MEPDPFCMQIAAGGDLQTLLDEDMVPYERDVISFTRQLLEGLVFIHDQNIVHLDIKPQNLVLMGEFPECAVKLCDFEISRKLTPGRDVREILGTPDYVAPLLQKMLKNITTILPWDMATPSLSLCSSLLHPGTHA